MKTRIERFWTCFVGEAKAHLCLLFYFQVEFKTFREKYSSRICKPFLVFSEFETITGHGISCFIARDKPFSLKLLISFWCTYSFNLENIVYQMDSTINSVSCGKCFLLCQSNYQFHWLPHFSWIRKKWIISAYSFLEHMDLCHTLCTLRLPM